MFSRPFVFPTAMVSGGGVGAGDFTAQALADPSRRRFAEATVVVVVDDRTPDVAALPRACAIALAPGAHP